MRDLPHAVMLFAAGFGTRMQHLIADRPKPLINVAGRPLIDHALDLARDASCEPVVANLHYKAEMLAAHLYPKGVKTIVEMPDILETGGGLRNALPLLGDGPVITMNSDAIWAGPNPLTLLQTAWQPDKMDALLMCIAPENAVGHKRSGDFTVDAQGRLGRGPGVTYGGVQILKTDLLAGVKEPNFSLNVIWDQMLEKQRLFGLTYPGRWCDVGHPDGIRLAEEILENADV